MSDDLSMKMKAQRVVMDLATKVNPAGVIIIWQEPDNPNVSGVMVESHSTKSLYMMICSAVSAAETGFMNRGQFEAAANMTKAKMALGVDPDSVSILKDDDLLRGKRKRTDDSEPWA